MTRYFVQPRDRIFVKGYRFLPFAKNTGKNIGKHISRIISAKYRQKVLDHAKQSATDAFKTDSKRAIQKTTEGTDLIGKKTADKITNVSKNAQKNHSETVINEHDQEIPKERKISRKKDKKLLMI